MDFTTFRLGAPRNAKNEIELSGEALDAALSSAGIKVQAWYLADDAEVVFTVPGALTEAKAKELADRIRPMLTTAQEEAVASRARVQEVDARFIALRDKARRKEVFTATEIQEALRLILTNRR